MDIFFRNHGPHISLYKNPFGAPSATLLQVVATFNTHILSLYTTNYSMRGSKKKVSCRRLGGYLKEQKGRLYIIRRCVVMLLCWHD
uniref:Uncharacterized protein n=1 Tax=Phaseolus vulgaris TaxID=3885 RepID=V7B0I7_PHAVU|nr:hypothetical protein PHAVU_008G020300g [Phaseolus vulgaris]ESW11324.1 hypothetical protein PHAVU_008G020300g [Phaseolus vulgaris]